MPCLERSSSLEELGDLGPVPLVEQLAQKDEPLLHLQPGPVPHSLTQAVHVPLVALVLCPPAH